MTEPDPTMVGLGRAMELGQRGERAAARDLLATLWAEIGAEAGDPLHRCAIAHTMADLQDDVRDELGWDLRALDAADSITDERAAAAGLAVPVVGFFPSLHLNVGECYRRLGEPQRAREHLDMGRAAVGELADDGYGQHVRRGLDRLAERLARRPGGGDIHPS